MIQESYYAHYWGDYPSPCHRSCHFTTKVIIYLLPPTLLPAGSDALGPRPLLEPMAVQRARDKAPTGIKGFITEPTDEQLG